MKRWLVLLPVLLLLCGCAGKPSDYQTEFFAMDTVMSVHLYAAKNAEKQAGDLIAQINELDALLSVCGEN